MLSTKQSWPRTLRLPSRPPKLIYLDLNHWIALSKAHSGHPEGWQHRDLLATCLRAVADGMAVFPISFFFYTEISKIKNHRQRRDLRMVIEDVCRYKVVTPLSVVATHEVEAILDQLVGSNPQPINSVDYLDWGVERAYGKVGGIRIKDVNGDDVTDFFRQSHCDGPAAFDAIVGEATLNLNRTAIEGPTPHREQQLRELGWHPEAVLKIQERSASEENAQVRRFDEFPELRRGRAHEVIMARQLLVELRDILEESLAARGAGSWEKFFSASPEDLRSLLTAMPSNSVVVTLKSSLHHDASRRWKNNDMYDIGALALTIPYCDIVVTDREMCSHVARHELPERFDTVVIPQLSELSDYLPTSGVNAGLVNRVGTVDPRHVHWRQH